MKLFTKGDKSRAICEDCGGLVSTTFDYRNVPFSDGKGEVKDILVAVCDDCGGVVATPPQSTPAIRRARSLATKSIEASVPSPFVEVLDAALMRLMPTATAEHRKPLLLYFAGEIARKKDGETELRALIRESARWAESFQGVPKKRISMKVTEESRQIIKDLGKVTGASMTDVLTGLIMGINRDVVRPKTCRKLEHVEAALSAAHA